MEDELDQIISQKATARDQQIAELENDVQSEKDGRQEDRFIALLLVVLAIDLYFFPDMKSWGGSVSILVIELFILVIAANRMGVDVIVTWLDKLLNAVSPSRNGDK